MVLCVQRARARVSVRVLSDMSGRASCATRIPSGSSEDIENETDSDG